MGTANQLRAASSLSSVKVAGVDLPVAEDIKVLGVVLDRLLTFDKHVSSVARSCNYHAQAIRHIRHLLTTDLAQTLECSLILSRIDYCNAAGTEQCRKDRLSSTKTITCTPAAEGTALVAGGAAHLLQAGRADVQDTAYVSTGVSQSAHQGMEWHSVTAVIGCSVSRCAVQTH